MTWVNQESPYDLAERSAATLADLTGVEKHDVALVLGSGWLPAAEMLGETVAEVATTDLPRRSLTACGRRPPRAAARWCSRTLPARCGRTGRSARPC